MLVRYSDWKKPTDGDFAFHLRPVGAEGFSPEQPAVGVRRDIREVCAEVLTAESLSCFAAKVRRWAGPDDAGSDGSQPYQGEQLFFEERGDTPKLATSDLETVLRGTALVLRGHSGATDYLLRDHHMVDVVLYHYRTTGTLPGGLFHGDRHSDWCRDGVLAAGPVDQAATWWKLLEGVKRPDGASVVREDAVHFANARAEHQPWMPGREAAGSFTFPGSLEPDALHWEQTLQRPGAVDADWVSVDLDYLQPSPQLRLAGGLLRDERFGSLLRNARVRVFVLSPQFTRGGDRFDRWEIHGSRASSLRLLRVLRAPREDPANR